MAEMTIQKGDIPEVDGLESGAPIKVRAEGKVTWNGDMGTISFDTFDVETENQADKEYRKLRSKPASNENQAEPGEDESFL